MSTRLKQDGTGSALSSCRECGSIYRTPYARCPMDGGVIAPLDGDPLLGETVAERYQIEDCVGEGAMGRVYRARHVRLSRRFAIKVLFGDLAADPTMRERFAREAEVASRLDHPNVVSVLDFGEAEGLLYLAMDFVEGENLADLIDTQGALAEDRVVALTRELCLGLQHAHDLGMVHRDFKPDNVVVVDKDGREVPRILDFGLAILSDTGPMTDGRLTTAGIVMGTPAYIAPEQATGSVVDHRADLFGLGVSMYEMLAGVLPFEGTAIELARLNVSAAPPPIGTRNPNVRVTPRLEKLVHRLMAKRPDERFESAARVIEALDDVAAGVQRVERVRTAPTVYGAGSRTPSAEWGETLPGIDVSAEIAALRPRGRRLAIVVLSVVLVAAAATLIYLGSRDEVAKTPAPTEVAAMAPDAGTPPGDQPQAAETTPAGAKADRADAGADAGDGTGAIAEDGAGPIAEDRLDAGPEVAAQASEEAAPPAKTSPRKRGSGKQSSGKKSAPAREPRREAKTRPEPAAAEISVETVSALYKRVGAAVQKLEKATDATTARPYRERYFGIPIADAIRSPALRAEIVARLKKLERDLARVRP